MACIISEFIKQQLPPLGPRPFSFEGRSGCISDIMGQYADRELWWGSHFIPQIQRIESTARDQLFEKCSRGEMEGKSNPKEKLGERNTVEARVPASHETLSSIVSMNFTNRCSG
jgi:hypothetical protein